MKTRTKIIASFLVSCQILGSALAGEAVEMNVKTAIAVSWQSELNKNYRILVSPDLQNWSVANPSVQGDGSTITRLFPKGAEQAFYRVEETGKATWLEGEWFGVATQDAAYEDWFDVSMRVQSGIRSFETTLVAPLGTCLVGMSLLSINDDTAEFSYTALEGGCDSGGKVTVTRLSENTVLWMDRFPADPALPAIYHGFAVLTKQ